ncbi:hypothetical protein Taro_020900 [Colocasia esculenta]|uniref:Uncharacterized protein n=1 Tax=Colocasia esculenta TaxID=4460 RepID=A0A843UXJ9_COLES|nr:hypothetical protein [Colocasia esculenta]
MGRGQVGFLLSQGGAKVAHMPVGNGPMRCMGERKTQVGYILGVVAQTRLTSSDPAANRM